MIRWRRWGWRGLWLLWVGMGAGAPRPAAATDTPAAEPEIALPVEPDGGCGAPLLCFGGWSVWSSAMPYYRMRDGGDLRLGFLGRHRNGTSIIAGGDYWLRSQHAGYRMIMRTPLREQGGRALAALARIESRPDARTVSLMLLWSESESTTRASSGIRRVDVSCIHEAYRTPAGVDVRQWPRARTLRLRLRGVGEVSRRGMADGLRVATTLSAGVGRTDRSQVFGQVVMTTLGWKNAWSVWAKAAWSAGRPLRNANFDLATDGQILSLPTWIHRGPHLVAAGIARHQPFYRTLCGLAFATHARLPGRRFQVWEVGIGIGFRNGSQRSGRHWILRIELPLWQRDPTGRDPSGLCRWSVRLWLWPRPMGYVASPDTDIRIAR